MERRVGAGSGPSVVVPQGRSLRAVCAPRGPAEGSMSAATGRVRRPPSSPWASAVHGAVTSLKTSMAVEQLPKEIR